MEQTVINRKGEREPLNFNAIRDRILKICTDMNLTEIDVLRIFTEVVQSVHDGTKTTDIDNCMATVASRMSEKSQQYLVLSSYIVLNNMYGDSEAFKQFYEASRVVSNETFTFNQTVINRLGERELLDFNAIRDRILGICKKRNLHRIDGLKIFTEVVQSIGSETKTTEIDEQIASISIGMLIDDYEYMTLASSIVISNLHKNDTEHTFSQFYEATKNNVDEDSLPFPLLDHERYDKFVYENMDQIHAAIDYERDYNLDYFGSNALFKKYLLKNIDGKIIEFPQDLYMRCAIQGYSPEGIDTVIRAYDYISQQYYTHATPTLLNSMTHCGQLASCFLLQVEEDSIDGMYETLKRVAKISKNAGGIGVHYHNVRSRGERVRKRNGRTTGLKKYLRVHNAAVEHVDQGGARPGAEAVYLTPTHPDAKEVFQMRREDGGEKDRARELFYAVWTNDVFMKRIRQEYKESPREGEPGYEPVMWSYFDPNKEPQLYELYGDAYEKEYLRLEAAGRAKLTEPIKYLWEEIITTQETTGMPYITHGCTANRKSNQKNIGMVKSSNLCTEIFEVSTPTETAVCNLLSIGLPKFVITSDDGTVKFDHDKLCEVTEFAVIGENCIIDENQYPTDCTKRSNLRHRPIGIGVQGLHDVFMMMNLPFNSPEAMKLDREIFETIYYGSLCGSLKLAKRDGAYETFAGSPASEGKLQFDLWDEFPTNPEIYKSTEFSGKWDWNSLKQEIVQHGLRNSLLVAPMPTAGTSQIMGNYECFEPITGNIYRRQTGYGEFLVVNKHLANVLQEKGQYNRDNIQKIIMGDGSAKNLDCLNEHEKNVFKTAWEISPRVLINMAAERGRFIDQSMSLNLFVENVTLAKMTAIHIYAWEMGLKTGQYYLRSRSKGKENKKMAISGTANDIAAKMNTAPELNTEKKVENKEEKTDAEKRQQMVLACSRENPGACEMCSS